jgi:hypothetical protein
MTSPPPAECARPLRRLIAILVLLVAVAATQAVQPAAQAQAAQPTISTRIDSEVVAELEAAGVTITGSRGATVRQEGDALVLSIPVDQSSAVVDQVEEFDGFAEVGNQRITTTLLGRLTITNTRTGRSAVLRDLQGVIIRGGFFNYGYLRARTSRFAPRFRFGFATSFPAYQGALLADENLVRLASSIAETPVIQNAIPNVEPPLSYFGYGADLEALLPPGTPLP